MLYNGDVTLCHPRRPVCGLRTSHESNVQGCRPSRVQLGCDVKETDCFLHFRGRTDGDVRGGGFFVIVAVTSAALLQSHCVCLTVNKAEGKKSPEALQARTPAMFTYIDIRCKYYFMSKLMKRVLASIGSF